MAKRVLITGMGGAIGVHVMTHILENTDWEIVGVDSFRHKGYYDRVTKFISNRHWDSYVLERVSIMIHDLNAPITEREIEKLGKIDYIINLASLSDVAASIEDPATFIRNNVNCMLNILEYAREAEPEVFFHFSTDEVYGPTTKDSGGHKEWDPILPSNPYSASKASQEAIAISYWRSYGLPLLLVNIMNNFGETQAPSKFPAMIQSKVDKGETVTVHAAGDGQIGTRYYLHSRNTADAVLFLLDNVNPHLHQPGEIDRPDRFNIVGDKQVSNLELAQLIADLMDKELKYELVNFHDNQPGHDLHYGLSGEKLAALGWESPMSFKESLKRTIKWQQENPEWIR